MQKYDGLNYKYLRDAELKSYIREEFSGRRVAVVGSSPKLLKARHGDLIDSHDLVARFNDADVSGKELHAGSKTTHRFLWATMNRRYFPFLNSFNETSKVITKNKNVETLQSRGIIIDAVADFPLGKAAINIFDHITGSRLSVEKPKAPRSGFVLLCYLAALGDDINVSIFGVENYVRKRGPNHFMDGSRAINHIKNWEQFHMALELEVECLNTLMKHRENTFTLY